MSRSPSCLFLPPPSISPLQLANQKGDGLREASNINKSLSALADVFKALDQVKNNPKRHVPYRNSKLTHMLKVRRAKAKRGLA